MGAHREEQDRPQPVMLTVRRPSGVTIFSCVWNGDKTLHEVACEAVGEPSAGIIWSFVFTGSCCAEFVDIAVDPLRLDTRICDIAENCTRRLVGLRLDVTLIAKSAWMTDVAVVRDTMGRCPKQWWRKAAATEQEVHSFACMYHHLWELLEIVDDARSSAAAIDDFLIGRGVDPTVFACSAHRMLVMFAFGFLRVPGGVPREIPVQHASSATHRQNVKNRFLTFIALNF